MAFLTSVAVCVMVWAGLLAAAQNFWIISAIGLAILAVFITDVSLKVLENLTNKELIRERKGKAVLITGCDSGFGKLLAERLDHLGFKVYACCLQPDGDGAQSLKEAAVSGLKVLKMDITSDDDVTRAKTFVQQDLGEDKLWCLFNNAGILELSEVELCPISRYQQVHDVNTIGTLRVTKAFLPLIREARQGRVVCVSSVAGRFTFSGSSAYSMSKCAVISLADGLRQEMVKWNISVHTIEPIIYKTPIMDVELNVNLANRSWESTSEDIRRSYGEDYIEEFKKKIRETADTGKPADKIHEVVDDMVHAVAAKNPKHRYVPSMATQFQIRLMSSLPMDVLNSILSANATTARPADLINATKSQK